MLRLLVVLALLLVGCGKEKIPTSVSTQLASDNEVSHSPDGIEYLMLREPMKAGGRYSTRTPSALIFGTYFGGIVLEIVNFGEDAHLIIRERDINRVIINKYGMSLDRSLVIKIGANQVLGSQQPAIADATSPEDMVRKFNLLLEELRNHGLIARGEQIALSN